MPYKDSEKGRLADRKRYAEAPEKKRAAARKWAAENRDKKRSSFRKWYAKNTEKVLSANRKRYAENVEKGRAASRKWQFENPEKVRAHSARRRALKRGCAVSDVDLEFIWRRNKGICYLCGEPIEPDDCHYDHVVPLSRGGPHTNDNLRPTHAQCNLKKRDRVIDVEQVKNSAQLKLF